jgi:hypothetical protein
LPLRHRRRYAVDIPRGIPPGGPTTGSGVPRQQARQWVRTAPRAISARFDPVITSRNFTALVPRVYAVRLANRTRTVWQYQHVPASSRLLPPSPAPPGSGCSSFSGPLRQATGEGLSPRHGQPASHGALTQMVIQLGAQRPLQHPVLVSCCNNLSAGTPAASASASMRSTTSAASRLAARRLLHSHSGGSLLNHRLLFRAHRGYPFRQCETSRTSPSGLPFTQKIQHARASLMTRPPSLTFSTSA